MAAKVELDFAQELEKTVVNSLVKTFGLDFLLFEDKKGGDVDTIHNVRNGVWASEEEKQKYYSRDKYDETLAKKLYRGGNENYRKKRDHYSKLQNAGKLINGYNGKIIPRKSKGETDSTKDVNVEHIIAAQNIHEDPAIYLSDVNAGDLACADTNLTPTTKSINSSKKELSADDYLKNVDKKREKIKYLEAKETLTEKEKKELAKLKRTSDVDKKMVQDKDKKARAAYNKEINWNYYTGSKFLKSTTKAAASQGLKMGARQAIGLVLAEIWFELREQIPVIYKKQTQEFSISVFIEDIIETLKNIWQRVKVRFKDVIKTFSESALGGALSSLSTTILNIFLTTEKMIVRFIREMWDHLVQVFKLIFFNPDNLPPKELFKECLKIISAGVALVLGVMLEAHLSSILLFPFGKEISVFISALATGVMTLAFGYFIDGGSISQLVWSFLKKIETKYTQKVAYMKEINAELDSYLIKLTQIEFNMDPMELECFATNLKSASSELEKQYVLKAEVERRGIELPFESGNTDSVRNWLMSKCK